MIRIGFGCFVVSILVLATLCHFVPSSKEYNVTKGIFTLVAQLGLLAGLIGTIIKEKRGRASFRCFLASIILGGIFPFLLNYLLERGQPCCLGCTLSGFVIFPIIFTLVGFAQGLIGIIKKKKHQDWITLLVCYSTYFFCPLFFWHSSAEFIDNLSLITNH